MNSAQTMGRAVGRLPRKRRWLWCVAVAIFVVWGVFLRFYDLGGRVYWEDETFTSLRVAGYTRQELIDATFTGDVIYPADLLQFQTINAQKHLVDTVASLADDVHPPLYFAMLRVWAERFGSSPGTLRCLSALIGLLLLPAVYSLGMTLFSGYAYRREVSELAIALVAVSPYHVAVAQEARMYSLWPLLTTMAGVFLLRAMRKPVAERLVPWSLYAGFGILSLYVHWFSTLVLFAYGLYVAFISTPRSRGLAQAQGTGQRGTVLARQAADNAIAPVGAPLAAQLPVQSPGDSSSTALPGLRMRKGFVWAMVACVAAILPWAIFVGRRLSYLYSQTTWTADELELVGQSSLLYRWWRNGGGLFFSAGELPQGFALLASGLALGLILASLVAVRLWCDRPIWAFLWIVSSMVFVPMAIADLTLGGQRSTIFRYLVPSAIGLELGIAFLLVHLIRSCRSIWFARGLIILLLVGGALSQTTAQLTFTRSQQPLVQVAQVLNQTRAPRLISDNRPSLLLPLAHLLESDIQLQLTVRPQVPDVAHVQTRDVFLYDASQSLKATLTSQGYTLRPLPEMKDMLKLESPPASSASS